MCDVVNYRTRQDGGTGHTNAVGTLADAVDAENIGWLLVLPESLLGAERSY